MTRPVSFTQTSVRRAIAAAQKAGLQVIGIRSDGTVLVANTTNPQTDKPIETEAEVVL
jgi:Mrp family chromosome partitioning ATPase